MNTIILMGRYGDIINLIPLAHQFGKAKWIVGKEFAGVLDGCSYIEPVIFGRGPDQFLEAVRWAKAQGYENVLPAQVFTNPDKRRETGSYNLESWRLARHYFQFGQRPLVFDQRNPEREASLIKRVSFGLDDRPTVLVSTKALSSPFPRTPELLSKLRGLDANIVDLGNVKAEKVYDLIGLFDNAACLVTVDTMHLHLARASYCPVVSLLNDGWCGSVPPPQAMKIHRYEAGRLNVDTVVEDVRSILEKQTTINGIVMAVDMFGSEDRHKRAHTTWPYIPQPMYYPRCSESTIRDTRRLNYFKDVIKAAMDWTEGDLIVWTNDDTAITETGMKDILRHASKFEFGCVRRDKEHIGRECFWFRRSFLERNFDFIPDVILGAPKCDLVLAKWLRGFYGIQSSLESLKYDFAPVDLPAGIVHHEHHISSWLDHQSSPSAIHNQKLWDNTL